MTSQKSAQSGQVGLAIMLVMVVVSTIGISVATRSTQEVTSSRRGQEAARTFEAAESAIEKVLSDEDGTLTFEGDEASYSYDDIETDADVNVNIAKQYTFNNEIPAGTPVEVDVSSATAGDQVLIEWADSRNCADNPASLVIKTINTNSGSAVARYETVSPCDHGDNFTSIDTGLTQYQGATYALAYNHTLQVGDQALRITPVYTATPLLIAGNGWTLPAQQFRIQSVGENTAEDGRETQAIEVQRSQPFAPQVLDYALLSGTTITK